MFSIANLNFAYLWRGIVRSKRSRPTLRDLVPRPALHLTCGLFHTCGWWMPVSLTIVVMGFITDVGNHNITVVAFRR
jgi:hypothetical protein